MDSSQANRAAKEAESRIVKFLRDMIAIPAESGQEKERCERVKQEYQSLGFDEVYFDGLGSVIAHVGQGDLKILMDGHIDCVGVGDPTAWEYDPFQGKLEAGKVFGRGAVDELPAIACMAYGAKIARDHGALEGVRLTLCASVMEEDCDGLPLQHLIQNEGLKPDMVVLGEPTDLDVYRGQRGRMGMTVTTRGKSAHGAHAHQGINAIYKMAPIIRDIEQLNATLAHDEFLGKGSITVSFIECTSPSMCAVPDMARIYIDRRLTAGETPQLALSQIRSLPHLGDAEVVVQPYSATSWTGLTVHQEQIFPTWVLEEEHPLVQGVARAAQEVLGKPPAISRWHFSTNGVASMGRMGIPTVGIAPGDEALSHSNHEWVRVEDLVKATAIYSLIPSRLRAAQG